MDPSLPREVSPLDDIDIRALAELDGRAFLTVYLPLSSPGERALNEAFVEGRVEAVRGAVAGNLGEGFEASLDLAWGPLFAAAAPGERGRVVVASAPSGFFEAHRLPVAPERRLVLDDSPFVLPLARLLDDHEDYAIVLLDLRRARVYTVSSGSMELISSASHDLIGRHRKGGMSQKRFDRLRREAIDDFVSLVAEDLGRLDLGDARGVVLAGPGEAKALLADALPRHLARLVMGTVDVDIDVSRGELLALGEGLADADEEAGEAAVLGELREAVTRGELAAVGAREVMAALVQGRVDTLVVSQGLSMPGWACERCGAVAGGPGACPGCGAELHGGELVEEMCELALRTGAGVEMVDGSPLLEGLGGVAALLRF